MLVCKRSSLCDVEQDVMKEEEEEKEEKRCGAHIAVELNLMRSSLCMSVVALFGLDVSKGMGSPVMKEGGSLKEIHALNHYTFGFTDSSGGKVLY